MVAMNGARLSAFAWFNHLFMDWQPAPLPVPTLHLRASQPMNDQVARRYRRTGLGPISMVLAMPGDHYTMMNEFADALGSTVRVWLE
jgi:hypothetical protein